MATRTEIVKRVVETARCFVVCDVCKKAEYEADNLLSAEKLNMAPRGWASLTLNQVLIGKIGTAEFKVCPSCLNTIKILGGLKP